MIERVDINGVTHDVHLMDKDIDEPHTPYGKTACGVDFELSEPVTMPEGWVLATETDPPTTCLQCIAGNLWEEL